MLNSLTAFLEKSLTAYHACEQAQSVLLSRGFTRLYESEDWSLEAGGKYFVSRGGSSLISFVVGDIRSLSFKIAASHLDSPALKVKENPVVKAGAYATLNVEKYGGGIWYTFFDRPLRLAGRVVVQDGDALRAETVSSPFTLTIPSLAIHQNRSVNDGFFVNPQVDLQPLLGYYDENVTLPSLLEGMTGKQVISYDLFLVNADMPYSFGLNNEFLASPRVDNLTSAFASIEALTNGGKKEGLAVAALLDNEETGSLSPQGADSDFMENTLRRAAYALGFTENDYYKALASSFLLSVDNAHATHPNRPEKSDPTNKVIMGDGVVLKSHANKAYITDGLTAAVIKTILQNAGVKYQAFFNRSDMASGSTLGAIAERHIGILGADVGLPQLAMHSACECFAKADYLSMVEALTAFFTASIRREKDELIVK